MADTTETKKYLINIESNLDKYAKEADEAAKKVAELKVANQQLLQSGEATGEEIERNNAALRTAQKEYANAKKSVDLATAANKAQSGSYEQLYRQWQLAQTQLKLMGSAYTVDANGVRTLSQKYIDNKKAVEDAKRALDSFGKGVADNRLNVGNYSEALQGALGNLQQMPGPLGAAAGGVQRMGVAFKALLANPVVLFLTAIVGALSLLVKAFKGNDEASEKFNGILKGIKTVITEVLGRIVSLGKAVGSLFKGDFAEAAQFAKEAIDGFGDSLRDAYKAGTEQQLLMNKIEDDEIALIEIRAKRERDIAELKKKSRIEAEGSVKQAQYLRQADQLIADNLADELSIQRDKVKLVEMELAATNKNQVSDELRKKVAEERAKLLQLETSALNEQGGLMRRLNALDNANASDIKKNLEEIQKQRLKNIEEEVKLRLLQAGDDPEKMKAAVKFQYEQMALVTDESETQRQINKIIYEEAIARIDQDAKTKELESLKKLSDDKEQWKAADDAAKFEYQRMQAEGDLAALNQVLDQEYNALKTSAEWKQMSYNQQLLAEEQYNQAKRELSNARIDQVTQEKLMVADALSVMSQVVGDQTIAGKAFAVAAAVINTWVAASKALADPTIPSTIARIALMASVIGTGLMTVKKILAVKVPGKGGGGGAGLSAPTSISASAPAVRSYAGAVGSSVLNTPQLNQQQINALPNQNILTANDLAAAFGKMPAPVVTVEDINARVDAAKKVEVRGTI